MWLWLFVNIYKTLLLCISLAFEIKCNNLFNYNAKSSFLFLSLTRTNKPTKQRDRERQTDRQTDRQAEILDMWDKFYRANKACKKKWVWCNTCEIKGTHTHKHTHTHIHTHHHHHQKTKREHTYYPSTRNLAKKRQKQTDTVVLDVCWKRGKNRRKKKREKIKFTLNIQHPPHPKWNVSKATTVKNNIKSSTSLRLLKHTRHTHKTVVYIHSLLILT